MVSELDRLEPAAEDTAGVIPTPLASSASHGDIGSPQKSFCLRWGTPSWDCREEGLENIISLAEVLFSPSRFWI